MKRAFVAIVLIAAIPALAKFKVKQKWFEPVVMRDARAAVGHYVGIEHEFEIDLRVDANGKLIGTFVQNGVDTPMRDLVIDGSELRSDIVRGTFADRVLNGDRAFGLKVTSPKVKYGDTVFGNLFCRKR